MASKTDRQHSACVNKVCYAGCTMLVGSSAEVKLKPLES